MLVVCVCVGFFALFLTALLMEKKCFDLQGPIERSESIAGVESKQNPRLRGFFLPPSWGHDVQVLT